ncbi:hypothetical protein BEL04_09590 [Mucilaginibacter sp. PPCGB 2223]|uniref:WD40/YVTN/BNR-like repeat-containing protein n=1 Tax=Mucilaginibacter sp. PPCGB 2223 TaxID=1886027 RepID=UPI000826C733|nr:hypothetical protein [Mucilaginibacter sp. PPCGB 2223]OCX54481.1 hypothetical protein BEL04_09590 [Mucilaginibacter sp. PPCGB 2223]
MKTVKKPKPINKKNEKIITLFSVCLALLLGLSACHKCHDYSPDMGVASPSGWTKVASLSSNQEFTVLTTSGNTVYAASSAGIVYMSSDLGATWQPSALVKQGTNISALAVFNNIIYAGTEFDGIFASGNGGQTWVNQSTIELVTSFTVLNNNLYASTEQGNTPGDGLQILNKNAGTWGPFNTSGLPSNFDYTVKKTIAVNQSLVSLRGGNGFFYTCNTLNNQWIATDYFNPHRMAIMRDITYGQGTLLVTPGTMLYGSTNSGLTWAADTLGLQKEPGTINSSRIRMLYTFNNKFYVVSNVLTGGGVCIQQRDVAAPIGTSWATNSEVLATAGFGYDFCYLNNILFLATDNGIYFKKIV